jgi:hypothetical protein
LASFVVCVCARISCAELMEMIPSRRLRCHGLVRSSIHFLISLVQAHGGMGHNLRVYF